MGNSIVTAGGQVRNGRGGEWEHTAAVGGVLMSECVCVKFMSKSNFPSSIHPLSLGTISLEHTD